MDLAMGRTAVHTVTSHLRASDLHRHLAALFAPGLDLQSFRNRTAELMREVTGCAIVSFAALDPATKRLQIDFDPFMPGIQAGLPGFGQHMAKYPCFNFDPTVAGGKPFLRSDFMTDAEFYASDIYLESFRLGGLTDHAAMLLPSQLHPVFFVGLERVEGTYEARHREVLTELQPHVANALRVAESLASVEQVVADPSVFTKAGLSPREAEVLGWLTQGKGNPDIAEILGIALPTVKTHIMRIFDKLGVSNRHEAVLRAHELARQGEKAAPNPAARRLSAHVVMP